MYMTNTHITLRVKETGNTKEGTLYKVNHPPPHTHKTQYKAIVIMDKIVVTFGRGINNWEGHKKDFWGAIIGLFPDLSGCENPSNCTVMLCELKYKYT